MVAGNSFGMAGRRVCVKTLLKLDLDVLGPDLDMEKKVIVKQREWL